MRISTEALGAFKALRYTAMHIITCVMLPYACIASHLFVFCISNIHERELA